MDDANKKISEQELAKLYAERDWNDVKYSNDRLNKVADQMITTEVQASAIFIALIGVFLGRATTSVGYLDKMFLIIGILLFTISIVVGILGFYIKELYWRGQAKKYNLACTEWVEVLKGDSSVAHAVKMIYAIRGGVTNSQSSTWPTLLQITFFFLGLIVSFIGLVRITF